MKSLLIFLGGALVAGILAAVTLEPATIIQGRVMVEIKPTVSDVMISENEKTETVTLNEVTAIRFDYNQRTWEIPFQTNFVSQSVTNMVKQIAWIPKFTIPPIPPAQNFQLRTATRVEPLPSNYGSQGPQVPASHPDIPR